MVKMIEVIIDEDEKYPEYTLYADFKNFCKFELKKKVKIPLVLYKKFESAQEKYDKVEEELRKWLNKMEED